MNSPVEPGLQLDTILKTIFNRKTVSVSAIDVRELTSYADTIVIIEGNSTRQVTSLAEYLIKELKNKKYSLLGKEGVKEGEWALLDYGDIIVHVFETDAKSFFNLEGLWADAPRIDLSLYEQDQAGETEHG